VDVHSLSNSKSKDFDHANAYYRDRVQEYDIPVRALIAKDADNLIMAGRCISGDFLAHSSYRVTGNAVQMGPAGGTLAALSALRRSCPHEVPWPLLKAKLGEGLNK
jgi:hypothetical protein